MIDGMSCPALVRIVACGPIGLRTDQLIGDTSCNPCVDNAAHVCAGSSYPHLMNSNIRPAAPSYGADDGETAPMMQRTRDNTASNAGPGLANGAVHG
jgi:hypothetical protein